MYPVGHGQTGQGPIGPPGQQQAVPGAPGSIGGVPTNPVGSGTGVASLGLGLGLATSTTTANLNPLGPMQLPSPLTTLGVSGLPGGLTTLIGQQPGQTTLTGGGIGTTGSVTGTLSPSGGDSGGSPTLSAMDQPHFTCPRRPNLGREGRPILLRANHFQVYLHTSFFFIQHLNLIIFQPHFLYQVIAFGNIPEILLK